MERESQRGRESEGGGGGREFFPVQTHTHTHSDSLGYIILSKALILPWEQHNKAVFISGLGKITILSL